MAGGVTIKELADSLGISKTTVSKHLKQLDLKEPHCKKVGNRFILDEFAQHAIAEAAGVTTDEQPSPEDEPTVYEVVAVNDARDKAQADELAVLRTDLAAALAQNADLVATTKEQSSLIASMTDDVRELNAELQSVRDELAVYQRATDYMLGASLWKRLLGFSKLRDRLPAFGRKDRSS